jgi:YD repeat-containing protein
MLCQAAWPDGTTTDLFYKSNQLARVVNPGGATTDLGYNTSGLLATVRTPLQSDALGAASLTGATTPPGEPTSATAATGGSRP